MWICRLLRYWKICSVIVDDFESAGIVVVLVVESALRLYA